MKQNSDESVLLRIRGYIAYETGDYANGVEYMSKFFKLHDPEKNITSDFVYYGRLLQKVGKDTMAINNYNKALVLDSTKTEIYEDLAKLYASNRMHNEAAEVYKKMISNGADKTNTYYLIGKEYYFQSAIYTVKYDSLMRLQETNRIPFADSVSVKAAINLCLTKADSAFTMVTVLNPQYAGGFWWKGRMQSRLDPDVLTSSGKDAYEKALTIFVSGDSVKNRKPIIECYKYLGSYYFLNGERVVKTDKKESEVLKSTGIDYFRKILLLDPTDAQALEVFKKLKLPLPTAN
jgi:tetratricopeptide (TPR) repeat protein